MVVHVDRELRQENKTVFSLQELQICGLFNLQIQFGLTIIVVLFCSP